MSEYMVCTTVRPEMPEILVDFCTKATINEKTARTAVYYFSSSILLAPEDVKIPFKRLVL